MQYFDLNIPYLENDKTTAADKSAKKQTRLKLIVKAMELGYSGIAYNRTIKRRLSESDGCNIPPFPLSSLLNASPSISSSVAFHRRLIGLPVSTPFRQYKRITVALENTVDFTKDNHVLNTYDIVAVTPLNQFCFDSACKSLPVDLISIDLSEKLSLRLWRPMIKAAIERGVYFEIMYSKLMEDVQVQRQTITNAKLLVEWTRGKNLILSSAASSVLNIRGPNDVANLSSLLGLSVEHAKAALSKNCRSLISNALKRKYFYKDAYRIEVMPAGNQTDSKDLWIVDSFDWDPISNGEGDLLLDDMAKSFAQVGKVSKNAKAIDFDSIVSSAPSFILQAKDVDFEVGGQPPSSDNVIESIPTSKDCNSSKETEIPLKEFDNSLLDQQNNGGELLEQGMLLDSPEVYPVQEGLGSPLTNSQLGTEKSDRLEASLSPGEPLEPEFQNYSVDHSEHMLVSSNNAEPPSTNVDLNVGCGAHIKDEGSVRSEGPCLPGMDGCSGQQESGVLNRTEAVTATELQLDQPLLPCITLSGPVLQSNEQVVETNSTIHDEEMMDVDSFLGSNVSGRSLLGDLHLAENLAEDKDQREEINTEILTATKLSLVSDTMTQGDSFPESNNGECQLVEKSMPSKDLVVEPTYRIHKAEKAESQSISNDAGSRRHNHTPNKAIMFPFKRLLHVQFKKKGTKSIYKNKKRRLH